MCWSAGGRGEKGGEGGRGREGREGREGEKGRKRKGLGLIGGEESSSHSMEGRKIKNNCKQYRTINSKYVYTQVIA